MSDRQPTWLLMLLSPIRLLTRLFGKAAFLVFCLFLTLGLNLALLISDEFYDLTKLALRKVGSTLGGSSAEYVPRKVLTQRNAELEADLEVSEKRIGTLDAEKKKLAAEKSALTEERNALAKQTNVQSDEIGELRARVRELETPSPAPKPVLSEARISKSQPSGFLPSPNVEVPELDSKAVKRAKELNKSIVRRSMRSFASDASSASAEAIPFVGSAVIAATTAWGFRDACLLMRDMRELEMVLNATSTDNVPTCGYTLAEIKDSVLEGDQEPSCREVNKMLSPELRVNCPPEARPRAEPVLSPEKEGVVVPTYD
ncbi:hypothetical protein [Roseovarius confluentis]|uniref:hypothetical protein n=1 Tax=Roseovarius confluentis TaxID=1852027 RepID=UPI0011AED6F7|nr:hypothetical protein [Roseovarius confluentis]